MSSGRAGGLSDELGLQLARVLALHVLKLRRIPLEPRLVLVGEPVAVLAVLCSGRTMRDCMGDLRDGWYGNDAYHKWVSELKPIGRGPGGTGEPLTPEQPLSAVDAVVQRQPLHG